MPPLPQPGRDEQERLRNRALATWLISGEVPGGADEVTSELQDHEGHVCAVVVNSGGHVVARFRVISRPGAWQLRPEPCDEGLPTAPDRNVPAAADGAGVFDRSGDLRARSAVITARSAELRLDSAMARMQARYWATRAAIHVGQPGTSRRAPAL